MFFLLTAFSLSWGVGGFCLLRFLAALLCSFHTLKLLSNQRPRLRSIVEALMSGFGAVGWIMAFIVIFNYIAGCMLMLVFRRSDPYHFGSVSRAMFNVLRMETLDSWDVILRVGMRGCDEEPGYDSTLPNLECDHPIAVSESVSESVSQ